MLLLLLLFFCVTTPINSRKPRRGHEIGNRLVRLKMTQPADYGDGNKKLRTAHKTTERKDKKKEEKTAPVTTDYYCSAGERQGMRANKKTTRESKKREEETAQVFPDFSKITSGDKKEQANQANIQYSSSTCGSIMLVRPPRSGEMGQKCGLRM